MKDFSIKMQDERGKMIGAIAGTFTFDVSEEYIDMLKKHIKKAFNDWQDEIIKTARTEMINLS